MAELKDIILICTKGHLTHIKELECQVSQWLGESLKRIALGEQKTCQLFLGQKAQKDDETLKLMQVMMQQNRQFKNDEQAADGGLSDYGGSMKDLDESMQQQQQRRSWSFDR